MQRRLRCSHLEKLQWSRALCNVGSRAGWGKALLGPTVAAPATASPALARRALPGVWGNRATLGVGLLQCSLRDQMIVRQWSKHTIRQTNT